MKKIAVSMIFAGAALMAADGATLFKTCEACHTNGGKNPALGKSAPIAGLPAEQIIKDLQGYKAGTLNKHGMGTTMVPNAKNLSDEDMKALADYISKLPK